MQRQAGEILHGGHLHEPVHQDVPGQEEKQKLIIVCTPKQKTGIHLPSLVLKVVLNLIQWIVESQGVDY